MHRLRGPLGLVLLFVLLLPAVTRRIYASDEIQYFAFMRSLWFDRDVSFDNEYRYFVDHYFHDRGVEPPKGFAETYLVDTATGYRKTYATIGCAILWAPFYGIADVVARGVHGSGGTAGEDGYSPPYVSAVCYASAFYGLIALLLSASMARRLVGASTAATLAIWIGTPLFFYMYLAPVFAHACEAFAMALLLWAWLRARERWTVGGAALVGAAGALAGMVREQELVFLAAPALDFAWTVWRRLTERPTEPTSGKVESIVPAAAGIVAFLIVYLPQIITYARINGHVSAADDVNRKLNFLSPHFLGVLFDTEHGLLFWTPLVVPAMAGVIWLAMGAGESDAGRREAKRIVCVGALLVALLNAYIAGSVDSWTAAGAFGQRRFVALTPVLILGLTALFAAVRHRPVLRWATNVIVALCVWWNLGLMAQFGLNTMDRQALTLGENARATFVTLPLQVPSLAWRYLTDRSSFYNRPRQ